MVYPRIQYHGAAYPDPVGPETTDSTRELDSRMSDGIHVRMLWHPFDGYVSVAVEDTRTGEMFELPVGDDDRPRDVFHHPYAYAAMRRRRTDGSYLAAADTALAA